jgi:hypothetical protein
VAVEHDGPLTIITMQFAPPLSVELMDAGAASSWWWRRRWRTAAAPWSTRSRPRGHERPFREYVPFPESRSAALAAFEPFVASVASTGRAPGEARDLALTAWGRYTGRCSWSYRVTSTSIPSSEQRIIDVVKGLVDHVR